MGMAPQQGDIYELKRTSRKFNRFITKDGKSLWVNHVVYMWILKIRPYSVRELRPGKEKARINNVQIITVYKPEIFPEGSLVKGPQWVSLRFIRRRMWDGGYKKLKRQTCATMTKSNLARFYRKIGVISSKSLELKS